MSKEFFLNIICHKTKESGRDWSVIFAKWNNWRHLSWSWLAGQIVERSEGVGEKNWEKTATKREKIADSWIGILISSWVIFLPMSPVCHSCQFWCRLQVTKTITVEMLSLTKRLNIWIYLIFYSHSMYFTFDFKY